MVHEGFEVQWAKDGREALSVFESFGPDIILLDIMLPEISGLEVLRRIRKTSKIPVIMVSARGETYDKVNGLDAGADDYISKPFEIEELLARLRAVIRRSEDNEEMRTISLRAAEPACREICFSSPRCPLSVARRRG